MGWQAWLTLAVVTGMFVAMVRGLAHPAVAIVSAVVVMLVALPYWRLIGEPLVR